ncbi:uncharacterized protein BDV17DRAFT_257940 [Aspergillus undulatus]|uniref:uncharacterized protein n=1 Tax=Aspergillus undulatus TaxID=1810928 RepID=UPI003CCE1EEE
MPTATSTVGWTLANLGPAPATFSLAPSCTESSYLIAYTGFPDSPLYGDRCESVPDDCYPTPTDSALAEAYESGLYVAPYYSPGPECPSDWKTVGAIAHPTDAAVTSSGVFTINTYQPDLDNDFSYIFGYQDAFGALLDPGETLIACCPSSMTVGEIGGCHSALPSQTISTACAYKGALADVDYYTTTLPFNGTTITGEARIPPTSYPEITSTMTTFNGNEASSYIAISSLGPFYFIHQPSDLENQASETGTNPTNAAPALRMDHGSFGQMKGVMVVFAVSVLAGMALVLPW